MQVSSRCWIAIYLVASGFGRRVLDLGCGTAYLAAALSKCVGAEGKVTAIGLDVDRLTLAQQRYAAGNLSLVARDGKAFREEQNDLVTDLPSSNMCIRF